MTRTSVIGEENDESTRYSSTTPSSMVMSSGNQRHEGDIELSTASVEAETRDDGSSNEISQTVVVTDSFEALNWERTASSIKKGHVEFQDDNNQVFTFTYYDHTNDFGTPMIQEEVVNLQDADNNTETDPTRVMDSFVDRRKMAFDGAATPSQPSQTGTKSTTSENKFINVPGISQISSRKQNAPGEAESPAEHGSLVSRITSKASASECPECYSETSSYDHIATLDVPGMLLVLTNSNGTKELITPTRTESWWSSIQNEFIAEEDEEKIDVYRDSTSESGCEESDSKDGSEEYGTGTSRDKQTEGSEIEDRDIRVGNKKSSYTHESNTNSTDALSTSKALGGGDDAFVDLIPDAQPSKDTLQDDETLDDTLRKGYVSDETVSADSLAHESAFQENDDDFPFIKLVDDEETESQSDEDRSEGWLW